jgi:hypothetical protein
MKQLLARLPSGSISGAGGAGSSPAPVVRPPAARGDFAAALALELRNLGYALIDVFAALVGLFFLALLGLAAVGAVFLLWLAVQ